MSDSTNSLFMYGGQHGYLHAAADNDENHNSNNHNNNNTNHQKLYSDSLDGLNRVIKSPDSPNYMINSTDISNPTAFTISTPPNSNKRRRKPAGTPDPDAEVVALSPKTLMETDRYVCEICNQGFQRDQNLQMHRRRHKVPWKLLKRNVNNMNPDQQARKRVYVCPEPSCLHHDPCHALGDLVGIKKHYRRKHSRVKQWECEKCSKAYAVQSDYKAHLKTCGTKGHCCDCGRVFSRVESFIEHQDSCSAAQQKPAGAAATTGSAGSDLHQCNLYTAEAPGAAMAVDHKNNGWPGSASTNNYTASPTLSLADTGGSIGRSSSTAARDQNRAAFLQQQQLHVDDQYVSNTAPAETDHIHRSSLLTPSPEVAANTHGCSFPAYTNSKLQQLTASDNGHMQSMLYTAHKFETADQSSAFTSTDTPELQLLPTIESSQSSAITYNSCAADRRPAAAAKHVVMSTCPGSSSYVDQYCPAAAAAADRTISSPPKLQLSIGLFETSSSGCRNSIAGHDSPAGAAGGSAAVTDQSSTVIPTDNGFNRKAAAKQSVSITTGLAPPAIGRCWPPQQLFRQPDANWPGYNLELVSDRMQKSAAAAGDDDLSMNWTQSADVESCDRTIRNRSHGVELPASTSGRHATCRRLQSSAAVEDDGGAAEMMEAAERLMQEARAELRRAASERAAAETALEEAKRERDTERADRLAADRAAAAAAEQPIRHDINNYNTSRSSSSSSHHRHQIMLMQPQLAASPSGRNHEVQLHKSAFNHELLHESEDSCYSNHQNHHHHHHHPHPPHDSNKIAAGSLICTTSSTATTSSSSSLALIANGFNSPTTLQQQQPYSTNSAGVYHHQIHQHHPRSASLAAAPGSASVQVNNNHLNMMITCPSCQHQLVLPLPAARLL